MKRLNITERVNNTFLIGLLVTLFLGSTHITLSQNMYKTEGERQLREGWDWVPNEILHGKLLVDRFSEDTKIKEFIGEKSRSELMWIDWWRIYSELFCAQKLPTFLTHPDSVLKRISQRDARDVYSDEIYSAALTMISADYTEIVETEEDLQHLTYVNNEFRFDLNQADEILNKHYTFATGISYNGPIDSELHLRIERENFFSNRNEDVLAIDISVNGVSTYNGLNFGSEVILTNLMDRNIIGVSVKFADGRAMHCNSVLEVDADNSSQSKASSAKPDDKHKFTDFKNGEDFKIGVWYGCNSDEKIRKPFVMCAGFTPEFWFGIGSWQWFDINPVSLKGNYKTYNNAGLLDDLRNKGYDVIIIKPKKGMISSERLSYIIEDGLRWVNNNNTTGHENIVAGASQGAVSARIALARMEQKHLSNNAYPYHHSKMYISWEGEHQGANAPIGTQVAIKRLNEKFWFSGWWESNFNHWFNSIVMKEYIIYNEQNTFSDLNTPPPASPASVLVPGPLSEFHSLQVLLDNHNHAHTESNGYPTFLRRVGISDGSSLKKTFDVPNFLAAFGRAGGVPLFYHKVLKGAYYSYHNSGNYLLYQDEFKESSFFITFNTETIYYNGAFPGLKGQIDRAPGSVFSFGPFGNGMHRIACPHMGSSLVYPSSSICVDKIQSFVPTWSALDLQNSTTYFGSADFNLFDAGLMYSNFPNITNGEYGYPHIGLGSSSLNHTPFDAIYSDHYNEHHVLHNQAELKNFIIGSEVQPDYLALQNRNVGEYLSGYTSDYEASKLIVMGKNVTVKEPVGDFVIKASTSSDIIAGELIHMHPGSSLEYGSVAHLHIGSIDCSNKKSVITSIGDDSQTEKEELADLTIKNITNTISEEIKIYPNPSSGTVTIELETVQVPAKIQVTDLQGRVVLSDQINNHRKQINLSNESPGIFLIKVFNEDEIFTKKLIKK